MLATPSVWYCRWWLFLQLSGSSSRRNPSSVPPQTKMEVETSGGGTPAQSAAQPSGNSHSPLLDDCLKLLRGERDEQRLAGLLLVTKFCNKQDHSTILQVYRAVGPKFLLRLLRTGMGKVGGGGGGGAENRDAYLQLSVTVLAAFCRVPEIAASQDMLSLIPLFQEIISTGSASSVIEDCYEFVYLVANTHEDGVRALYDSGSMQLLASQLSTLPDGSPIVELAMRLVQLIISRLPAEKVFIEHPSELAILVVGLARLFALLQTALKFEALHLLSAILSSQCSAPVRGALNSMANSTWSTDMRVGIVAVLNNRVAPAEKLQALILAECTISIVGEEWLIGSVKLPDVQDPIPVDRCMLLVLGTSRVEIAVLLNELARLRDEASKSHSLNAEVIHMKQRNLAICYSLVEKVIKLVSKFGGDEDLHPDATISDSTLTMIISGLNETISVVLDYLEDVKDHGENKGDDLLASVRLIGSYLAETPHACGEKVKALLGYMLSIQGEDEASPFYSICFLIPMLCQITMRTDGCKLLASSGAYGAVIEYLIRLIAPTSSTVEDAGSVSLACDTILNFLMKREQIAFTFSGASFIKLLSALSHWTEDRGDPDSLMMASSICALILDSISEETLIRHPDLSNDDLVSLSQLMKRSLAMCGKGMMSDEESDLYQIVHACYLRWVDRFPRIKELIER